MSDKKGSRRRNGWITLSLVALLAAVFVVSFLLAPRSSDPNSGSFGGTDSAVTDILKERGVEPWFKPLFEPPQEIASGLFALQAAVGAGVIGYVLGNLRGRKIGHAEAKTAQPPSKG